MTEKQYGGASPRTKSNASTNKNIQSTMLDNKKIDKSEKTKSNMKEKDKQDLIKAGEIFKQVAQFTKSIVKKDVSMLKIAEEIEAKILELGGEIAFPVNLGINDIAAHHSPAYNDTELAYGLLKVDFGVHINGLTADGAISFDLEDSEENRVLIKSAENALKSATQIVEKNKDKTRLSEIGKEIQQSMSQHKTQPIINLSGHSIHKYDLHAGITIPNVDNKNESEISTGIFAIEPFATTNSGSGKVYDSRFGEIYHLIAFRPVRDPIARQVLDYIEENFKTLPFCSRWIVKKFGTRGLVSLKQLVQTGSLHNYAELVESSHQKVAQAEHTLIIDKNEVIIVN